MKIALKIKDPSAKIGFAYPQVEISREEWNTLSWGSLWEELAQRFEVVEVVDFRIGEVAA